MMTEEDLNRVVGIEGVQMAIKDIPDAQVRAMFGYGHFPQEIRRRKTFPGYPRDPCYCNRVDDAGIWIKHDDGLEYLVCSGCGLDGT